MSDNTSTQEVTPGKYLNPFLFSPDGQPVGVCDTLYQVSYVLTFLVEIQCGNRECGVNIQGESLYGFNYLMLFLRDTLNQCSNFIEEETAQFDRGVEKGAAINAERAAYQPNPHKG